MQQLIDYYTNENKICGISIASIEDNKVSYYNSGLTKELDGSPITSDTLFDCASLTKVVVTTTLMLKLIDENHLTLDTKVSSVLKDFRYDTTIQDLLTHESGYPSDSVFLKQSKNRKQLIDRLYDIELDYKPRIQAVYSDINFIILGLIIESVYGDLSLAAKKYIFAPLGMYRSTFNPLASFDVDEIAATEVRADKLTHGIVHDTKGRLMEGVSGSAGLFSTTHDLSKFIHSILNDEKVMTNNSKQLLKTISNTNLDYNRTLGWIRIENDYYYHTGFTGTSILFNFDSKHAIIIISNRIHPNRDNDCIFDLRDKLNAFVTNII